MNSSSLMQGAAFDIQSLDALKRTVKNNPQGGLKTAAKQMEGVFIQMMLKSMRDASFKDGLFSNQQSEMFTSMYDQQIAQNMAEHSGLGLADMMVKQLGGQPDSSNDVQGTAPVPLSLKGTIPPRYRLQAAARQENEQVSETAIAQGSGKSDGFVSRLLAPAIEAAKKTGIPHQLIIAQAALESGWGNREITTKEGKPSHNLFGIKATPDWKGDTTEITTTEYTHGVAQKIKARFRVYKSYSEALTDYASLLTTDHRYQRIAHSATPEKAAHILQSAGYATDPDYAHKLINIIGQVKNSVNQAISSYKTDLSKIF